MKKIFLFVITFLFLYVSAVHNSVLAYCIVDHSNTHQTSHHTDDAIEEHKCCFTIDSGTQTVVGSYSSSSIEKTKIKKLISATIDFQIELISLAKENSQKKVPKVFYESQINFYTTLLGAVKSII